MFAGYIRGLITALIAGVGVGSPNHINLVETISWKWNQFWKRTIPVSIGSLVAGLLLGLIGGLIFGVVEGLVSGLLGEFTDMVFSTPVDCYGKL
jgi:Na+/H+ antiporter NhaB